MLHPLGNTYPWGCMLRGGGGGGGGEKGGTHITVKHISLWHWFCLEDPQLPSKKGWIKNDHQQVMQTCPRRITILWGDTASRKGLKTFLPQFQVFGHFMGNNDLYDFHRKPPDLFSRSQVSWPKWQALDSSLVFRVSIRQGDFKFWNHKGQWSSAVV